MQSFLTDSPWDHGPVQREIQAVFAERLASSASRWWLGTVGVIDESGFAKSGLHSVGAARQYSGRQGKVDVCQVGVFLLGATPDGHALLDHQLYLPEDWAKDKQRRKKTGVPKDVKFQTKPELAAEDAGRRVRFAMQCDRPKPCLRRWRKRLGRRSSSARGRADRWCSNSRGCESGLYAIAKQVRPYGWSSNAVSTTRAR